MLEGNHHNVPTELGDISLIGMPSLLTQMLNILGVEDTYRILEQHGGQIKYIAKNPDRCVIKEYVASDKLLLFCQEFGGVSIEVPKLDHLEKRIRNKKIQAELQCGSSVSAVARRYHLSVRQIRNIKIDHL